MINVMAKIGHFEGCGTFCPEAHVSNTTIDSEKEITRKEKNDCDEWNTMTERNKTLRWRILGRKHRIWMKNKEKQ